MWHFRRISSPVSAAQQVALSFFNNCKTLTFCVRLVRYFEEKLKKEWWYYTQIVRKGSVRASQKKTKNTTCVTFFTCYAVLTLIISHVYAMQINLHLVIAILVAQHSAFFFYKKIFLSWDFVILCVLHTHFVTVQ